MRLQQIPDGSYIDLDVNYFCLVCGSVGKLHECNFHAKPHCPKCGSCLVVYPLEVSK